MNLWVNRVRQLAPLAVALFFFACEDDTSFLGFQNPNKKFKNYTIEIPLESKVFLLDKFRSSNFVIGNDVNRFLVGSYSDPVFGNITSSAVTQFAPFSIASIPLDAQYDSATLILAFDQYFNGSETEHVEKFTVHQVTTEFDPAKKKELYNNTPYDSTASIGGKALSVWPQLVREHYEKNALTARDSIRIKLNETFGKPLLDAALKWSNKEDVDSVYYYASKFVKQYKGIAIKPAPTNTMMIGLSTGSFSQIIVYYHTADKTGQKIVFTMNFGALSSFNQILADRSAAEVGEFPTPLEEQFPANGKRYVQAGTGIVTEINFDKFLMFADTVEGNIIINDAQLIIEDVEVNNTALSPPSALHLRHINPDNTFRFFEAYRSKGSQDSLDVALYKGFFRVDYQFLTGASSTSTFPVVDADLAGYVLSDGGSGLLLRYSAEDKTYTGNPTMFLQQLYRNRNTTRFKDFILFPAVSDSGPAGFKSTNGVAFPEGKIKIRFLYTKPTVSQ